MPGCEIFGRISDKVSGSIFRRISGRVTGGIFGRISGKVTGGRFGRKEERDEQTGGYKKKNRL
ncbi:MAG: hypothetical protein KH383_08920 [Clostridium sp.]|uniref:hypothetical protein n=1 Tax=Clostridium sp. AF15-41 TaxID=2292996 RepID=UPI001402B78E|nr:hypothetical protein [Clostridium sp. AF15-41]MBS6443776.1 hypothetical protein [Clostridium sp.]